MNYLTPLLAATLFAGTGLVPLLVQIAILAVVVWAVIAIIRWSGIPIPQPVVIVLTALVAILIILWLAKVFGLLV